MLKANEKNVSKFSEKVWMEANLLSVFNHVLSVPTWAIVLKKTIISESNDSTPQSQLKISSLFFS